MQANDLSTLQGYSDLTSCNGDNEITDAYTGDLLSDVMGNAPADSVLITIQAHKNTVAVASLAGIKAIVICNGRTAPQDMIDAAKEEDICIFATNDTQFAASCKIAVLLGKVDACKN